MDVITICAANYLPFVNVLGHSFLNYNPNSTFSVLVIDAKKIEFQKESKFQYLTPRDLQIPENIFENMAFYYNVTELATALKPSAMKALFAKGSKKVIYLDPDIQVFSELNELDEALDVNSIVLTPHTLDPMPRDGLRPSEADIMGSGTFNLGFLGLSKSDTASDLLDWWEERLRFDSISDPLEMLFTDQRWIDLVPSYFAHHVLRHPGYNVAYWNLHERKLTDLQGSFEINGESLKFFHFSGYRPDKPWILSKYVSDNPRIVISKNVTLQKLCSDYADLAHQQGWLNENAIEYGYQNFDSGKFIPSSLRRLYREDCIKAFKSGEILEPPKNWQTWATERSIESGNLSRILFSVWKSRPDLKRRYPDATGAEANDFVNWARRHGVEEKVIDQDFLHIGGLVNDVIPSKFATTSGINIAGYLSGELGLGQSARLIYESAIATGLPVTTINSNRITSRQQESFMDSGNDLIYPVTIAIVNADHFKLWVNDFGKEKLSKTYVIGVWAWETEDFPVSMHSAFEYVDEIWAVSDFVKLAISKHTKKPIFVIPTPIFAPSKIEKLDRTKLGISDRTKYNLFIFDYASVFNRKNPLGLARAHMDAFPNSDGPTLVIKSTNGDKDSENREKLRYFVRNRSDIILLDEYMSRTQLTSLINECEIYISLHRSEGYGLTMAEAMALGKPVIATEYSGNLEFMNSENSFLVPFEKVKIGPGSFPYDENSMWAEPNLSIASKIIRDLHANLTENKIKNVWPISDTFSVARCSDFISSRVKNKRFFVINIKNKYKKIVMKYKKIKSNLKKAFR